MIWHFIAVSCAVVGAGFVLINDTVWSQIQFYKRLSLASIKHFLCYLFVPHLKKSEAFTDLLLELAKTDVLFVKVIQAISFNYNFLDADLHAKITQFSDNVPYDADDIDIVTLDAVSRNTSFVYVDTKAFPFRSGMISLIYALRHKDTGKEYVLKVKRLNIDERLGNSIDNMSGLLYLLSVVLNQWFSLDVTDVISRHLNLLREQLDFSLEMKNTLTARSDLADVDYIRIPEIYNFVSFSDRAIIMERLPGKHMNEIPIAEREMYSDLAIKYFFVSSVIHHKFHGDMHSGNVLFIDNGTDESDMGGPPRYQLGIIDFGIVTHFPENITETLFYVFEHQQNPEMTESITRAYMNNFMHPPNVLDILGKEAARPIVKDASCIARAVFQNGEMLDQSHFYRIFQCINDNITSEVVAKYDIKTGDGFVKFEVAISMCNSLVIHLTGGDMNTHMKRVFDDLFHRDLMFSDDDKYQETIQ